MLVVTIFERIKKKNLREHKTNVCKCNSAHNQSHLTLHVILMLSSCRGADFITQNAVMSNPFSLERI